MIKIRFVKRKNFFLQILIPIFFITLPIHIYCENYFWFAKSGIWNTKTLDSGNKVLIQEYNGDWNRNRTAIPYLMYHTLILKKDLKAGTPDQINLSEIKYNIKIESIYANDKMGETSTFLTGTNEKELYFVALFFNKNYFHKVSLIKSSIIDPKLPLRVYGNFRTEEIAYSNIQFPTYEKKEVNIKLYDQGMKIFLNDQKILSYESTSREKWRLSSNNFFGIGIRGAHAWIDDVNLVGKNNIADKEDSILFEDKFNNVKIMRLTFKKIK